MNINDLLILRGIGENA